MSEERTDVLDPWYNSNYQTPSSVLLIRWYSRMNGVKCRYRTHLDGSRIWTLSDNTGRFFNISAEEDFLIGKIKAICEVNGVDIPAF